MVNVGESSQKPSEMDAWVEINLSHNNDTYVEEESPGDVNKNTFGPTANWAYCILPHFGAWNAEFNLQSLNSQEKEIVALYTEGGRISLFKDDLWYQM